MGSPVFVGEGEVRKEVPYEPQSGKPAGMLIALRKLSRPSKKVLEEILKRKYGEKEEAVESPEPPLTSNSQPTAPQNVVSKQILDEMAKPEPPEPKPSPTNDAGPLPPVEPTTESSAQVIPEKTPAPSVESLDSAPAADVEKSPEPQPSIFGDSGSIFGDESAESLFDAFDNELDDIFGGGGSFDELGGPTDWGGSALPHTGVAAEAVGSLAPSAPGRKVAVGLYPSMMMIWMRKMRMISLAIWEALVLSL